jgi:hypothetical protein
MRGVKNNMNKGLLIDAPSEIGEYSVVWNIDVSADHPKEACEKAIKILKEQLKALNGKDVDCLPPVFEVVDCFNNIHVVDFEEDEE